MKRIKNTALILSFLVMPLLAGVDAVYARDEGTEAVLLQCRKLSFDQTGFEECLAVIERESELTLTGIETDWLEVAEEASSEDNRKFPPVDQLRRMAVQFREYRDQACAISVMTLDELSADSAIKACRISLNRTQATSLQRSYIEARTTDEHGTFYRGFLLMTDDGGLFQSCELRLDWRLTGSDDQLDSMSARYAEVTAEALELVYVELRGEVLVEESDVVLQVNRLNMLRPVLGQDCTPQFAESVSDQPDDQTDNLVDESLVSDEEAVTTDVEGNTKDGETLQTAGGASIDEYGAAGFMYGYFGDWTSMCATDAQQVCQAQTQHSLATEGNWQLLIDRSNARNWRIRLMPTTNSHVVGGAIQLSLDGVDMTTIPVESQQILLEQRQTLMQGDKALQLINRLRSGGTLELTWNNTGQTSASVIFSLNGVTSALDYFDTRQ